MAEVPNIFVFDKDSVSREVATITRLMLSFGLPDAAKEIDPDAASATLLGLLRGNLKKLVDIHAAVDGLEGFTDGLEGALTTLQGYVDGLEALTGTTNSSLTTLAGYLDGLEALIGTSNTALTTLQGLVDSLEGYTDGLEAKLDTLAPILPGVGVDLAFTTTSAQSSAITATRVRLQAKTADCRLLFGSSPTALTTSMLFAAGHPEYFAFTSGQKIAAIRDGAVDGTLNITPAT